MPHILVVDDHPVNRQLLTTLLGYYGMTVGEAADGAAALESIARHRPDLVITDLLMPNVDGEELCRRLRANEETRALPVIIYTAAYRERQARQIADRAGVRWVLAKPSEPAAIVALVAEALGMEQLLAPGLVERQAMVPGSPGIHPPQPVLQSVQEHNRRLTRLLEDAMRIAAAQGQTLAGVNSRDDLRSLALRQTGLVNLSLEMSWQRDPDVLVETFCSSAQDILSARYLGVVLLAANGAVARFTARGLDQEVFQAVGADIGTCDTARQVLGEPGDNGPAHMVVAAREGDVTGLPRAHPPVRSLLACPLSARDSVVGWMYAADRLGDEAFSADDERLMLALGATLASAWAGITVLDDLERRVAHRTRDLQAANAELQAFSSIVSHDLRTPLGAIGGFVQVLTEKFGALLPPQGQRYLGIIERNTAVMGQLIEDLLTFARTSQQGLALRPVELGDLARRCVESFREEIDRRGVTVLVGPLATCRGDPALLSQVLSNLVGNALKYSRNQPHATIEIGCRRVNAEYVVFVKDNGIGFDMDDAQKLFAPFVRLHQADAFEGTGIGLAIVRQIVERHGGRTWAEARPGQGACISFTLPVDLSLPPRAAGSAPG